MVSLLTSGLFASELSPRRPIIYYYVSEDGSELRTIIRGAYEEPHHMSDKQIAQLKPKYRGAFKVARAIINLRKDTDNIHYLFVEKTKSIQVNNVRAFAFGGAVNNVIQEPQTFYDNVSYEETFRHVRSQIKKSASPLRGGFLPFLSSKKKRNLRFVCQKSRISAV